MRVIIVNEHADKKVDISQMSDYGMMQKILSEKINKKVKDLVHQSGFKRKKDFQLEDEDHLDS
jgi:hypothetical protein